MCDARQYDGVVIRRGGEYLVALPFSDSAMMVRWSTSPWDGCLLKEMDEAEEVANYFGGDIVCFNPVTGVLRNAEQ